MVHLKTISSLKKAIEEMPIQQASYEFRIAGATITHIKGDEVEIKFDSGTVVVTNVASDMDKTIDTYGMKNKDYPIFAKAILACRPLHGLSFETNEKVIEKFAHFIK